MTSTGTEATQSIVVEYDLAHAPAKVWRALTESELVSAWLMKNDLRPIVGHKFTFQSQPMPGWDGVVHCEVTEALVEHKLTYTWRGGSGDFRLDTVVTWTLTPTAGGGTLLRLEHTGFTAKNTFAL